MISKREAGNLQRIIIVFASPMALPFPGEKLFLQTEDSVLFKKGEAVANRIFSPLVK